MRGRAVALAGWTGVLLSAAGVCFAQQILYGGNEWLQVGSVNEGWLVSVDPDTAAVTPIGRPSGVSRLVGLAFDSAGRLWAATLTGTGSGTVRTSTLIQLNPADGSIGATIGAISDSDGGELMGLESLAIQPGTDMLLGSRGFSDLNQLNAGDIYRIDKTTGVATLFANNNNGFQESSIAFAPSGVLYQSLSQCCAGGNPRFQTLDPATGAVLTSLPAPTAFKALAVRADGAVFGAAAQDIFANDVSELYRIDPATAAAQLLGETGHNPIGSLAFGPAVPTGPCVADAHTLCLNGSRFAASARFRRPNSIEADATGVALTPDSGYLWFFDPANIEIVVKVLRACSLNPPAYWVFAAGLTNVEVTLTVIDTETGSRKAFVNGLGQAFEPIQDTSAFSTCP